MTDSPTSDDIDDDEYDERYQAIHEDEQAQQRWDSIFGWCLVLALAAAILIISPLPDSLEVVRTPAKIVLAVLVIGFLVLMFSGDEDEY